MSLMCSKKALARVIPLKSNGMVEVLAGVEVEALEAEVEALANVIRIKSIGMVEVGIVTHQ